MRTRIDLEYMRIRYSQNSAMTGTGLFLASARMTLDFAFKHTGVNRLEARAVVH
jgi:RimJ/RimL family protein N-acetyltransferase